MTRPTAFIALVALTALSFATPLRAQITGVISEQAGKPSLAVPDFKGAGSQDFMGAFNSTLFSDLSNSGLFNMVGKSLYPLNNPQRPEDLRASDNNQGFALPDWAGAPVNASHLVFGYTAAVNGVLAAYGFVDDTRQPMQSAQLLNGRYTGTLDQAGAIKVAHEFATDIIQKFGGGASLLGTRIYYVNVRGGNQEIWVMDWDGNNQKQLTRLNSISNTPTISADGSRLAFTTYARKLPAIMIVNPENGRQIPFYNQEASLNTTPSFTPDAKQIFYASTAGGIAQIYSADTDGRNFRRVSRREQISVEPKVNPKNPNALVYVAGPPQQIYRMNADGGDVQRLTNGEGEASNPSWSPDGQHIAFSWTRGYAKGDWNVFVMDVASGQYTQLTHSEGRNENPVWAPDGIHIVFASTRTGTSQIYTMLADGQQVKQLTRQGTNKQPVWGAK
jgi:TolB protein